MLETANVSVSAKAATRLSIYSRQAYTSTPTKSAVCEKIRALWVWFRNPSFSHDQRSCSITTSLKQVHVKRLGSSLLGFSSLLSMQANIFVWLFEEDPHESQVILLNASLELNNTIHSMSCKLRRLLERGSRMGLTRVHGSSSSDLSSGKWNYIWHVWRKLAELLDSLESLEAWVWQKCRWSATICHRGSHRWWWTGWRDKTIKPRKHRSCKSDRLVGCASHATLEEELRSTLFRRNSPWFWGFNNSKRMLC